MLRKGRGRGRGRGREGEREMGIHSPGRECSFSDHHLRSIILFTTKYVVCGPWSTDGEAGRGKRDRSDRALDFGFILSEFRVFSVDPGPLAPDCSMTVALYEVIIW